MNCLPFLLIKNEFYHCIVEYQYSNNEMDAQMLAICNQLRVAHVDWITAMPVVEMSNATVTYSVSPEYKLEMWNDSSRATIKTTHRSFTFCLNSNGTLRYQEMRTFDALTRQEFSYRRERVSVHQIVTPAVNVTKIVTLGENVSTTDMVNADNFYLSGRLEPVVFTAPSYRVLRCSDAELAGLALMVHGQQLVHIVIEVLYVVANIPSGTIRVTAPGRNQVHIMFYVEDGRIRLDYSRVDPAEAVTNYDRALIPLIK